MFENNYNELSAKLEAFLGERVERLSRETGFVKRQSKLMGETFVRALVFGWLERPDATLNGLVQTCEELGVTISEAGLHQRLNDRGAALLKRLFEEGLHLLPSSRRVPAEVLQPFTAVYVLDSTTLSLPKGLQAHFAGLGGSGSPAAVKVRLSMDYLTSSIEALEVVSGRAADQNCHQHLDLARPGSLHLFDLGFFKQQVFEGLTQAHAFFVSRWQTQTAVYEQGVDGMVLDMVSLLAQHSGAQLALEVRLGQVARLPVRLLAQRLSAEVVAQRRRKAARQAQKRGETCSTRQLALLEWAIFITNIPAAWLTAEQIMLLYRLRWQVELIFKLWKSQAQLDQVGQCGLQRFLCQFYARLLGLLLFQWLLTEWPLEPKRALSLPKAFTVLQRAAATLRSAFDRGGLSLAACLTRLARDWRRFALKQQRRTNPSTLARLLAAGA